MSRQYPRRIDRQNRKEPMWRLLRRLPFEVTNRHGVQCTLEPVTDHDHVRREVILRENESGRTWTVHAFPNWHFSAWEHVLYEVGIPCVPATWQYRLLEQLAREKRAELMPL